jgi:ankyrin repeat protein
MISAVLKRSNFHAITNKTTEEMEKLKADFTIVYPDLQQDWLQSCELLLYNGAQSFEFHNELESAAMIAARQKCLDVFLQMIESAGNKNLGYGINSVNKENESVLMVAIDVFCKKLKESNEKAVEYNGALASLLQLGANANQVDKKSSSALMRAIQYNVKSIVQTILSSTTLPIEFSICSDSELSSCFLRT